MTMADTAPRAQAPASGSRQPPRFTGSWPQVAQLAWIVLLLFALLVLGSTIQSTLQQVHVVCTEPQCAGAELTRPQVSLFHRLGLPVEVYGVYVSVIEILFFAVFGVVAAVLIWRRPGDRLAVFAAFILLLFGGLTLNVNQGVVLPSALWLPANVLGLLGSYGMTLFFYLFPNGRFVLRWPLVLTVPWAVFQAGQALAPGSALDLNQVPLLLNIGAWCAMFGSVIYVQVYRYRTVSTPAERQQTKWIVYGVITGLTGFLAVLVLFPVAAASALYLVIGPLGYWGFLALIPLSIGFALLRYRLWDVDVLVNRTLVYGLLTALLATLYVCSVVLLQVAFHALTGQGSGLAVAISTLAIAALFQPLRRGIQSFIDRRFYRRKYDAARTLAAFSTRLRDDVELDAVTAEIVAVVQETLQPAHVSLWLR